MTLGAPTTEPLLFTPLALRAVTLRNRIVISPMGQGSAVDGRLTDWHFAHLAKFAVGGAGVVFVEDTAVRPEGRRNHGSSGLWSDDHVPPLARIAAFLKAHGATPAIQLGHTGRKASVKRGWEGFLPLDEADLARGERPWPTVSSSALAPGAGYQVPRALSTAEIADIVAAWAAAARRAEAAGCEAIEIHGAHGYLIHQFLSPLVNARTDAYGGPRERRMRFALEVAEAVRAAWPAAKPLFFRVSAIDGPPGGWGLADTVALARELKRLGVDVIDCSSGGLGRSVVLDQGRLAPGYQVPYAEAVRREAGIATMAVGLILDPLQAEAILARGQADLVAIARQALDDPHWPAHAAAALGCPDPYALHPVQYGHWLRLRARQLDPARVRGAADG
ncbi:MAG: NADH:flavin oxidoreductase/NADH oxidase [Proteobacteria bacterium]|nr:NADH:flavin oxidoreductase/NADH oxidase [Pseudomonadota bacterium]